MAGFTLKNCPAYDEWQFYQAEELRAQLIHGLARLSAQYASLEDFDTAITHARRWLALDPLHEPAHRQLIILYEGSGQRAAALRQYETCRQIFEDELGVEPSQITTQAYRRILRAETLQTTSEVSAAAIPLIGRQKEWQSLSRTWQRA